MKFWRSVLFAPANRSDLLRKLPRLKADVSIIDLEDGTPASEKAAARQVLKEAVRDVRQNGFTGQLLIRINASDTAFYQDDIKAAAEVDVDGIVLPKCETAEGIVKLLSATGMAGGSRIVVAGIETIKGVFNIRGIASAHNQLAAVYFGAEDLAADIGARRTDEGDEVLYARSRVLLAAKAAGIAAIDQAVVKIRDSQQFERDARKGRDLGYDGKICLGPAQVALANRMFLPDDAEVSRAERLLDAFSTAGRSGVGVISFEGQMVDEPLVKKARAVVELARKASEITS